MKRSVGLFAVFALIFVFVPSTRAQFDEEEEEEGGGGVGQTTALLCMKSTSDFKCQHIFGGASPDGSCGGAECDGPNSGGCSPTSVIRSNPNWNSNTGYAYVEACVGENGFESKPKAVNCKVDQVCGCGWNEQAAAYVCQLKPSWTVLQSYTKNVLSGSTSCAGTAICP